jgi:hypothetical protein
MPPTINPQDNNNFSDLLIKYGNIKLYNGFLYGLITGTVGSIIIFSIFHKCDPKTLFDKSKIILV